MKKNCFLINYDVNPYTGPYVPVLDSLGTLPEFPDQRKIYDLTANGQIPPNAKAVLVYVFVTTLGDGNFQRGWYEISTRQGETKYSQFMNVATGQGLMAVNSGNLWFLFGDGKLDAKLSHPSDRKRSIAGKMADEDEEWSGVFVIGYRA